jgi:ribosomal protein L25 (general stress protein Ctc)
MPPTGKVREDGGQGECKRGRNKGKKPRNPAKNH